MKTLSGLVTLLLLLSACTQSPPATDSSLGKVHSENWEAMLNAGDIEGLLKVYTDDTRVLPPNGKMKVGLAAVREEFGAMIAAGMMIDLNSIDSKAAGDVAYNVGTYVLSIGGETIDTGKWIETVVEYAREFLNNSRNLLKIMRFSLSQPLCVLTDA